MSAVFNRLMAVMGTPYPVLISGEIGVGKSHIVNHLLEGLSSNRYIVEILIKGKILNRLDEEELLSEEIYKLFSSSDFFTLPVENFINEKLKFIEVRNIQSDIPYDCEKTIIIVLENIELYPLLLQKLLINLFEINKAPNFRIISTFTSNGRRQKMMSNFFYSLKRLQIDVPPLRERPEDIPVLLKHFIEEFRKDTCPEEIHPEVFKRLSAYPWPYNIRELRSETFFALQRCGNQKILSTKHFNSTLMEPRFYVSEGQSNSSGIFISSDKVIHLDRLVNLGLSYAQILHELKGPLTGIIARSELALESCSSDSLTDFARINKAALKCRAIIQETLGYMKSAPADMSEVNFEEIIDMAIEFLETTQYPNFSSKVTINNRELLRKISGKYSNFKYVFTNLLKNSLEAVGFRKIQVDINSMISRDILRIEIKDNGPGIQVSDPNRIFDPFFSNKTNKGGSGIGLTTAKFIVESYNGNLFCYNAVGGGAVFAIELPFYRRRNNAYALYSSQHFR